MQSVSPLRYPGGKASLYPLMARILAQNSLSRCAYAEPYAGGCGLALSLLFHGQVARIQLNDLDRGVWAFWHTVLNHTDELKRRIQNADINLSQWRQQKMVVEASDTANEIDLGFAVFFLNRTNRSGVIKGAGVIGGEAQSGNYKMDCRFNKQELIRRIERISQYRNQIELSNEDALTFMKRVGKSNKSIVFFYIDPPYYLQGSKLYSNSYDAEAHTSVAREVQRLKHPYLVTYDAATEIKLLYASRRQFDLGVLYSLQQKRMGKEVLIASDDLIISDEGSYPTSRAIRFLQPTRKTETPWCGGL